MSITHPPQRQLLTLRPDGTVYHSDNTLFATQTFAHTPLSQHLLLLQGLLPIAQQYTRDQPLLLHAVHHPLPQLSGYYDFKLYGNHTPCQPLIHCIITERTTYYQQVQAQQQQRNNAVLHYPTTD